MKSDGSVRLVSVASICASSIFSCLPFSHSHDRVSCLPPKRRFLKICA